MGDPCTCCRRPTAVHLARLCSGVSLAARKPSGGRSVAPTSHLVRPFCVLSEYCVSNPVCFVCSSPPSLGFTRFMMWMTMLVCFPYGRSAAQRLRNAERFIHDNDYAKARRASRRSLIYSLKGLLIGILFIAVILGVLLWVLVWQHIVN